MELFSRMRLSAGRYLDRSLSSPLFSWRDILKMYLPIVGDQVFISVIGLLNTSMVSASGQDSVAAMSLANPLSWMIFAVFDAVSAGATVIIAQYYGKRDIDGTRRAAGQVVVANFVVSAFTCLLTVLLAEGLLRLLYGEIGEAVITKARDYIIGVGISLLFHSFYLSAFSVLRGIGNSSLCLVLSVIINLTHLGFSVLFINVLRLDIVGTALSLIAARILGGGCAMYSVMRKKAAFRITFSDIFRPNRKVLGSVFRIGLPFTMERVFAHGGTILVQTFLVSFGEAAVAANAIANSAFSLISMAPNAVATLAITVVGQAIGAKDSALARRYGKSMVRMSVVASLFSIAVFLPMMPWVLELFQAPKSTVSLIWQLMMIALFAMPFFWGNSGVLPGVLRAAGDCTFPSTVSLVVMWVVRVGVAYLICFPLSLGVYGIWISMVLEWAVRTVIFRLRFRSDVWTHKKSFAR